MIFGWYDLFFEFKKTHTKVWFKRLTRKVALHNTFEKHPRVRSTLSLGTQTLQSLNFLFSNLVKKRRDSRAALDEELDGLELQHDLGGREASRHLVEQGEAARERERFEFFFEFFQRLFLKKSLSLFLFKFLYS